MENYTIPYQKARAAEREVSGQEAGECVLNQLPQALSYDLGMTSSIMSEILEPLFPSSNRRPSCETCLRGTLLPIIVLEFNHPI